MLVVFVNESREDKNIVHVYDNLPFSNVVSKKIVHYVLEGHRRIGKSEEHNVWLEKSFISDKCCFLLIFVPDMHIIIPASKVQLCENDHMHEFVNKFGDKR